MVNIEGAGFVEWDFDAAEGIVSSMHVQVGCCTCRIMAAEQAEGEEVLRCFM